MAGHKRVVGAVWDKCWAVGRVRSNLQPLGADAESSPINHVHPDVPPTLLIHGDWDELVPVDRSEWLAMRLKQAGAPVELITIPLARHAFDQAVESPASQLGRRATAAFLKRQLG